MKILIVGGGPGGLYAAILLKKANPDHDIYVYERNPDGATYGWGVVFSDRTINTFREADHPSYQRITDEFVYWTAIDIHYRGEIIRADGHDFAGMSRRRLLQILQDRCRELGVHLFFEHEAILTKTTQTSQGNSREPAQGLLDEVSRDRSDAPGVTCTELHPEDYDLVIAADGVNSRIRTDFARAFQPTLSIGKAKFIWFGTNRVLDAFTFIFKETDHGLFQVHAYPFDGQTSTFIVECAEDVWQRAGLDQATEDDSIAFCEGIFGDFLQGAHLLSNRSLWINFIRVKCKNWRHENTILLGDSAHTAHFSIGSGTKLAMDGSIALAQAFETTSDLDTALRLYEMERRPRVDALQIAAQDSRIYFENIRRYLHLQPQQFAFHLLTRSGRIHYDNLRTRDPHYSDSVDRWFGGSGHLAPPPMFTPFKLRGMTLKNRFAVTGDPARAVQTGAGLVFTAPVAVSPEGRITPEDRGIYEEAHTEEWKTIVEAVHKEGDGKVALVLNHAGRRGATRPRKFGLDRPLRSGTWPLLAPSPIPFQQGSQTPKGMTTKDMAAVRKSYTCAAQLAHQAGFDLLHLHCGHGYLLGSFLSPLTNQRDDKFSGSLENRLRFPLEVFDAVRETWPEEKPLSVALNMDDWNPGGITPSEAIAAANAFKEHGCDLIEALAGQTTPNETPSYGPGFLTPYTDRIRQEVEVPTLVGGYLTTSGEVNTVLASGRADLCLITINKEDL